MLSEECSHGTFIHIAARCSNGQFDEELKQRVPVK